MLDQLLKTVGKAPANNQTSAESGVSEKNHECDDDCSTIADEKCDTASEKYYPSTSLTRKKSIDEMTMSTTKTLITYVDEEYESMFPPEKQYSKFDASETVSLSSTLQPTASSASLSTIRQFKTAKLPLDKFQAVMRGHHRLRDIGILSCSIYSEQQGGQDLNHFVVLEIRRVSSKSIFLRMERRVGISSDGLLRRLSGAAPVDSFSFSRDEQDLVGNARTKDRTTFDSIPTLGELEHLTVVIREELMRFPNGPANSYMFSYLVRHCLTAGTVCLFPFSGVPKPEIAHRVVERVEARMRKYYHMPAPYTIRGLLTCFQEFSDITGIPDAIDLCRKWDVSPDYTSPKKIKQADEMQLAAARVAKQLSITGRHTEAVLLSKQRLQIAQDLACHDPDTYTVRFAVSQGNHASRLRDALRYEEATTVDFDTTNEFHRLFVANPVVNRSSYAVSLHNLGMNLRACGRLVEARDAAAEAVDHFRLLHSNAPWDYKPFTPISLDDKKYLPAVKTGRMSWGGLLSLGRGSEGPRTDFRREFHRALAMYITTLEELGDLEDAKTMRVEMEALAI